MTGVVPEGRARPAPPPEAFAAALAALPGMGPARLAALLRRWSPAEAWRLCAAGLSVDDPVLARACRPEPERVVRAWARAASDFAVDEGWAAYQQAGVGVQLLGGHHYPPWLADDPEAPAVLFFRGSWRALDRARVGIVGTRRCSHEGRAVAHQLGRDLARAGVSVVSGLALGIDGAAHEGVLSADAGPPVGVVGSGLDVVYPRRNAQLWRQVAAAGLLVSESPLGARPEPWRFPVRNRIIAALAQVLVVVESHLAGGSRHTVEAANDRGVPILAVPGSVRNPASAGTNQLLAEGCGPARDADDVLAALSLETVGMRSPTTDHRPPPAPEHSCVLEAVGWSPSNTDQVVERSGRAPARVAVALAHLDHDGWIESADGWFTRIGPR